MIAQRCMYVGFTLKMQEEGGVNIPEHTKKKMKASMKKYMANKRTKINL